MTRLIDADALCEEFKRRQRAALRWKEQAILADNEESKIRADAVLTFLSEVKLTIDNAPTVEQPTGEWIPVSERLPEEKLFNPSGSDFGFDFEEVLCTTIWGDVRAYKFGKPMGHDKPHFWFGAGIMDEYVIAWQYKPEPYKKEKKNESKN